MVRDYFERKRIWLFDSSGNLGLSAICLIIMLLGSWIGISLGAFIIFCNSIRCIDLPVHMLIPMSEKEKKNQFLTDLTLNILIISVPLLINLGIVCFCYNRKYLFAHPVFVAVCFISLMVLIAHSSINNYFIGCSGLDRFRKICENAPGHVITYEVIVYIAHVVLAVGLVGLIINGYFFRSEIIAEGEAMVYDLIGVSGIIFLSIDMARTVGGRNEHIHTV